MGRRLYGAIRIGFDNFDLIRNGVFAVALIAAPYLIGGMIEDNREAYRKSVVECINGVADESRGGVGSLNDVGDEILDCMDRYDGIQTIRRVLDD